MPWGKSEEQKQAEAAAKEREVAAKQALRDREETERQAQEERRRAEWSRRSYLKTPLGQAEVATENGARFFQLTIAISELDGTPSSFGSSSNRIQSHAGAPDLLGQIEERGWRLEHVGYVFVETGSTSTNRVLSTGQGTVTKGQVQGIYLFRRTDTAGE